MGEDDGYKRVDRHVSCIVTFWTRLVVANDQADWLKNASAEKRAALKRDLQPIIDIINEL